MFVCVCNGLTDRAIRAAIEAGARSHEQVYEACNCTAQCYSCAAEIDATIVEITTSAGCRP